METDVTSAQRAGRLEVLASAAGRAQVAGLDGVDRGGCEGDRHDVALTVRPADSQDAVALADLARDAFRATYGHLLDHALVEAVVAQACTSASFVDRAARPAPDLLLVADEDGVLTGFLDFAQETDGLELRRLYARAGETGRGVGAALLAALEDALPAGTTYRIVVVQENVRGLAFWQRHGFRLHGEVDGADHFAGHRHVHLQTGSRPVRLLELHRTVPRKDA